MLHRLLIGSAAICLAIASVAAAGTVHVDDDAPNDPGPGDPLLSDPAEDGSAAHPYDAVQEAVAAASAGDVVLIADGLYSGPGNHDIDLLGKSITVRSASGDAATCTIDASLGAPPVRGFVTTSGEGPATIIEGLTITGGTATEGAGLLCIDSRPTVRGCTLRGNVADRGGGAFVAGAAAQPAFINCRIETNDAVEGAGIAFDDAGGTLVNCLLLSNLAQGAGGAIMNRDSSPRVVNCTIVANTAAPPGAGGSAGQPGGGIFTMGRTSTPLVVNCIVRDNAPGQVIDNADGATTSVRYTNIEGGWSGLGESNIDADPLFVAFGQWTPAAGSPVIDAGLNWGLPVDSGDLDGDGNAAELLPRDLAGQPRFNADKADFDPGCGVPVVVDMGAYEYQFDPARDVIHADLNGDGIVNVVDLLAMLAAWGSGESSCLGDLNASGATNVVDLLALLSSWTG